MLWWFGSAMMIEKNMADGELVKEAITKQDIATLRYLFNRGVELDKYYPLRLATSRGWNEGVLFLIAQEKNQSLLEYNKKRAFLYAVQNGQHSTAKLFVAHGVDVDDAESRNGNNPIHIATDVAMIDLLLDPGGADISKVNKLGKTALCLAIEKNNITLAFHIVDISRDIDLINDYSSLVYKCKDISMLQKLLDNGMSMTRKNSQGDCPLHIALVFCPKEIVMFLLEEGYDINCTNKLGETPLLSTIKLEVSNDLTPRMLLLLHNGVGVNIANVEGDTPLLVALKRSGSLAYNGTERLVRYVKALIEYGADLNATDAYGQSPVQLARDNGFDEIVSLLLASGASQSRAISPLETCPWCKRSVRLKAYHDIKGAVECPHCFHKWHNRICPECSRFCRIDISDDDGAHIAGSEIWEYLRCTSCDHLWKVCIKHTDYEISESVFGNSRRLILRYENAEYVLHSYERDNSFQIGTSQISDIRINKNAENVSRSHGRVECDVWGRFVYTNHSTNGSSIKSINEMGEKQFDFVRRDQFILYGEEGVIFVSKESGDSIAYEIISTGEP